MEIEYDTGSSVTIISQEDLRKLNVRIQLHKCHVCFRSYNKHVFKSVIIVQVRVSHKEKNFFGNLYVVPNYGIASLGRRWIRACNIQLHDTGFDIENMVKTCQSCCEIKTSPVKAPTHQWVQPTENLAACSYGLDGYWALLK